MMSYPSKSLDVASPADALGVLELENPPTLETCYRKSSVSAMASGVDTVSTATAASLRPQPVSRRVLGTASVVAITYFFGCGGPLGSEPIISSSGPLIGLPAMVLYPLLVTAPYAYVVAELCCAFPEDGGFSVWVLNAFGPSWGFQVGYWSWVAGVCNAAMLPGFLLRVLDDYYGPLSIVSSSETVGYFAKAALALLLTLPSLAGTKFVAKTCLSLLVLVLLPVLVFAAWAYARARDWGDLLELKHEHNVMETELNDDLQVGPVSIDCALLLNTLFFAYDGVDMASVFAGEVRNPAGVYARAITLTVLLTLATIVVPMPGAILVDSPNWTHFTRDSYPALAMAIGGPVLKGLMVASSALSVAGLFVSAVYCKAIQVAGMSESELVPALFARRNMRCDSPHVAIGVTVAATIALLGVDLDALLPMANAFAGAVQIAIILAAIRLRTTLPFIPRPTKVPGGVRTMLCMALLPAAMLCYIVFDALSRPTSGLITVAFLVPGVVYGLHAKRRVSSAPCRDNWQ